MRPLTPTSISSKISTGSRSDLARIALEGEHDAGDFAAGGHPGQRPLLLADVRGDIELHLIDPAGIQRHPSARRRGSTCRPTAVSSTLSLVIRVVNFASGDAELRQLVRIPLSMRRAHSWRLAERRSASSAQSPRAPSTSPASRWMTAVEILGQRRARKPAPRGGRGPIPANRRTSS